MTLKPSSGTEREPNWAKSSYSTDEGAQCVEVATSLDTILIRDSKNPDGPRLTFTPAIWADFLPYASASGH
ncbi:DUF397 domain-containing protein [Streptomyces sp. DSM 41527]|uniref:DUF397 domain-containing protein n=1 Tax=Streptomyces mooreae TaxID=3075523 RepID=A0ABU2TDM2_9ACTN|nr:DUF397 domain-containing protein [Streptomyces sp. DSM 41527]MDT0459001.1 DUF397 domain-containing protein [Streptomyces sp. DSM 41527]